MHLIVGTGAIGTSLAYYLSLAGLSVSCLVRNTRLKDYRQCKNLTVTDARINATHSIPSPEIIGDFSQWNQQITTKNQSLKTVFLTVKQSHLKDVCAGITDIPPQTIIVPCLNGVRHIEWLKNHFPNNRIYPMTINFNAKLTKSGLSNNHLLDVLITTKPQVYCHPELYNNEVGMALRNMEKGKSKNSDNKNINAATSNLTPLDVQKGGEAICWGKLLINLNNPIGALTNSTFKDLLLNPTVRRIYLHLLDEAVDVLKANNIEFKLPSPLPYALQRWALEHAPKLAWLITKRKNGLTDASYPSMHADLHAGQITEIDAINGEIIRLASKAGLSAPMNAYIVEQIKNVSSKQHNSKHHADKPHPTNIATLQPKELLEQLVRIKEVNE